MKQGLCFPGCQLQCAGWVVGMGMGTGAFAGCATVGASGAGYAAAESRITGDGHSATRGERREARSGSCVPMRK